MNDMNNFLSKCRKCPVCNSDLTLYIILNGKMYQSYNNKGVLSIQIPKSKSYFTRDTYITIDTINTILNVPSEINNFRLAYLCNTKAICDNDNTCELSFINICYYIVSDIISINREYINDTLRCLLSTPLQDITFMELISLNKIHKNLKKYYMLEINNFLNYTRFYYCTDEDKSNILNIEFPHVDIDFSKENRQFLFDRFDSWVLMA
jgi:hypothetical protein